MDEEELTTDAETRQQADHEREADASPAAISVKLEDSLALAAAQYRSSATPLKQRVRILGIPLPIGGVLWATSILVHAALIWIGVTLYRHFIRPPQLQLALGDGGANPAGIMWREQTPGGMGMPQIPEVDAVQSPAPDSMTSLVSKLESKQEPQLKMNQTASSYVGPQPLWGTPPPVGAGHSSSDIAGPLAAHRGNGASNVASAPPAQQSQGTGQGKSAGNGSGQVNGGRAGVPTGTPDPTLPAPVYPEESRRRGEQGIVKLSISIMPDGTVGDVSVVSETPYPRLTRSAIDAVRQAHFDPAYAGQTLTVPYNFVLH